MSEIGCGICLRVHGPGEQEARHMPALVRLLRIRIKMLNAIAQGMQANVQEPLHDFVHADCLIQSSKNVDEAGRRLKLW